MDARLVLVPDEEENCGVVKPVTVIDGVVTYGLSIGSWSKSSTNGNIHIVLNEPVDTIVHETATSKAVNAELRASTLGVKFSGEDRANHFMWKTYSQGRLVLPPGLEPGKGGGK